MHACSSQFFFSLLIGEARSQDPLSPETVDEFCHPLGRNYCLPLGDIILSLSQLD